jgi:hypothetical protein
MKTLTINNRYKLDKTAFKMHSHASASHHYAYWKSRSLKERLAAAAYLNSVAYNYSFTDPPKMDRNYFSMRSLMKKNG